MRTVAAIAAAAILGAVGAITAGYKILDRARP
jgi:hypothetical protein